MLPNPADIQKYLYIEKTPTWKVRSLYLFGLVSWYLIVSSYVGVVGVDPFYSWFVLPILILLTIYHTISFGLNLFYQQFGLKNHLQLVKDHGRQPWVDIFLPVCGEEIDVLKNTWYHVSRLRYPRFKVYVLDDSKTEVEAHRQLALSFGFEFFERPNKGEMKKAGNLKYAYERTGGEFIAIFDADFAPHPDFLLETLPYMDQDPKIGIVQTPQYFDVSPAAYQDSPLAYNAAYAEEPFYRFIQVTRSRFGGTVCCGSNAVYRRRALDDIGGPYQIDYSEDAHTGFAMISIGYRVKYVPVLLAIGLSPDNPYTFFHQQHRWSMGSMRLMLSKKFWLAPVSWKIKFCYLTGFLFYLHHPLVIIFPLQLFWTLFFYNEYIPQGSSFLFYPHLIFAISYLWWFPIAKLRLGYFNILTARTYAYAHAVKTAFFRKSVSWISTNARQTRISPAFRQTTIFISIYVAVNLLLILLGYRSGDLHLFDHRYLSVQFWIFWNFSLSAIVFTRHLRIIRQIESHSSPVLSSPTTSAISPLNVSELSAFFALGFIFFEVIWAHLGFVFGHSLSALTLPLSFSFYCLLISFALFFVDQKNRFSYAVSYILFTVFSIIMLFYAAKIFPATYDTSWDGQGYHSNGIISFAEGWNPIYQPELPFKFPDASIFVRGYPKALWLIQSSIYQTIGFLDAAKITNLLALLVAAIFVFRFLQKLKIASALSLIISLLLVLQPPFFMQLTSFMADLFSYQMLLIAISALGIYILETSVGLSLAVFVIALCFLMGTKFSNLPLAGVLGLIFLYFSFRKFQSRRFISGYWLSILMASALIFNFIPYGTNYLHYGYPFYPSQLPEIRQSYQSDNTPQNLVGVSSPVKLFYSIFSASQLRRMSKNHPQNLAVLKLPFTFTVPEIRAAASIYNDRVGAAGPLFSGVVVLSLIVFLILLFKDRKTSLVIAVIIVLGLVLALVNPAPNLLRYHGQLILVPFFIIITIFTLYKSSKLLTFLALLILLTLHLNTVMFDTAVFHRIATESQLINHQLAQMKNSFQPNIIKSNNFFSSYIRLKENQIPFVVADMLPCPNPQTLVETHSTVYYCPPSTLHSFLTDF